MTTHTALIARLRDDRWVLGMKDRRTTSDALEALEQQIAALTRAVDTDYEQLYREANDQLAALTKERDELLILLDNWKTSQGVTEDQLAAAQARESKLRDAMLSDSALAGRFHKLLALPTDDSALMERLKQERERCVEAVKQVYFAGKDTIIKEIRSMT